MIYIQFCTNDQLNELSSMQRYQFWFSNQISVVFKHGRTQQYVAQV